MVFWRDSGGFSFAGNVALDGTDFLVAGFLAIGLESGVCLVEVD